MRDSAADELTKAAAAREGELVLLQVEAVRRLRERLTVLHFKSILAGKPSPLDRPEARQVLEDEVLNRIFGPDRPGPSS